MTPRMSVAGGMLAASIFVAGASATRADLILPKEQQKALEDRLNRPVAVGHPLVIKYDPQAQQARLQIPREFLPAGGAAKADSDDGADASQRFRTIVAGVAMSLAVAGLFFVRRKRSDSGRAMLIGLVVFAAAIGAAASLWADSPAPRPVPRPHPPEKVGGPNRVAIEILDQGDAVVLTLVGNAPDHKVEAVPPPVPAR